MVQSMLSEPKFSFRRRFSASKSTLPCVMAHAWKLNLAVKLFTSLSYSLSSFMLLVDVLIRRGARKKLSWFTDSYVMCAWTMYELELCAQIKWACYRFFSHCFLLLLAVYWRERLIVSLGFSPIDSFYRFSIDIKIFQNVVFFDVVSVSLFSKYSCIWIESYLLFVQFPMGNDIFLLLISFQETGMNLFFGMIPHSRALESCVIKFSIDILNSSAND